MLAGRALVSDVPTLLKHLVEDGEAPGPVAVTLVAPADLSLAPHWQNRQATSPVRLDYLTMLDHWYPICGVLDVLEN